MNINKIHLLNNKFNFSAQKILLEEPYRSDTLNEQVSMSSESAAAIKSQNMPHTNKYTFLQNVNIPSLNVNGNLYLLPNGQKCLLVKRDGPCVLKTFFKVGSMNEPDNLRGISHYIEHNLFNGSEHLKPTEFVETVNKLGGKYNASTGFTCTDYYIQSPLLQEKDLETFIKMHADMLSNPKFSDDMLTKEKGPVVSEIQMLADSPSNVATNTVFKNLFNIKTTSGDLIGGSVQNIQNMTRDDVVNYYHQNYNPKTAITVVIGDIDEKKTLDLLADNFKDFKAPEKIEQMHENLTPITQSVRNDLYLTNTQSDIIQMGFAAPADRKEKQILSFILVALTGHKNARLAEAMHKLNLGIDSGIEILSNDKKQTSAILFSTSTANNNTENVLKLMYKKIHEMAYVPMSEKELNLTKKIMKNDTNFLAESNMGISNLLANTYMRTGEFSNIKNYEKNVDSITPEDVMKVARKFLDLNKTSICVVHPKQENKSVSFSGKSKIDYSIETYKTKNNAMISILNSPNSKLCSLDFSFNSDIKSSKAGMLYILENMLLKGTAQMSECDFANIKYENNILNNISVKPGIISASYTCPKESLRILLDCFHKNIYSPALTQENFEKAKQTLKNAYYASPKSAVARGIETLYEGTEAGFSSRKAIEDLDTITFDEVVKLYNEIVRNAQLKISITGNLKDKSILNDVYSSISNNGKTYNKKENKYVINAKELEKVSIVTDTQELNQADIVQLYRIKSNGNIKDIAAMKVLNEVLGGNSNSRLFNDLREKQKLAYKVTSEFYQDTNEEASLCLRIFTTTDDKNNPKQSENLQKAIDGFNYHIKKLVNEKISQRELDAAKLQFKSNLLFGTESTSAKNNMLKSAMNTAYKQDYLKSLFEAIDSLTPSDIKAAAQYFLTKPSVISIVASKKTINENREYLKKLGELKEY